MAATLGSCYCSCSFVGVVCLLSFRKKELFVPPVSELLQDISDFVNGPMKRFVKVLKHIER